MEAVVADHASRARQLNGNPVRMIKGRAIMEVMFSAR